MTNLKIYLIAAASAAVIVLASYACGRLDGANSVQVEWDAERIATAAAIQQQTERVRAAEHAATQTIATSRERTDASITDLNARHARALDRVRREAGAGGRNLPRDSAAQSADCAAEGLPDRDGVLVVADQQADQQADQRWLLDLARDADITRQALDACREQYLIAQGLSLEN